MADNFEGHTSGLDSPATKHPSLTADAVNDINPRPRAIYCSAAGSLTLTDDDGVSQTYTMAVGDVLTFRPVRCTAIASGSFIAWS